MSELLTRRNIQRIAKVIERSFHSSLCGGAESNKKKYINAEAKKILADSKNPLHNAAKKFLAALILSPNNSSEALKPLRELLEKSPAGKRLKKGIERLGNNQKQSKRISRPPGHFTNSLRPQNRNYAWNSR